ncbi:MBL fold metallo-hydrolase [Rhizobium sp. CECT 9324]|uniref:MBL fold metallo-hydrolase n=1 Tax=Rhizobium sp. CECT 9324 TaxID=2845820 RepID=UPI000DDF23A3|nr:MBL fold metallo-hydrolase [Rhizobium sp. CECT 9324]CAH0342243.1 Ribonuclease BN [Rhizobium sp. CECT 9324]
MKENVFSIKFWGSRGSIPVSGPQFQRYGGNTPCIEVRCGEHRLLFDAGSGIREVGMEMLEQGLKQSHLFFSHCHYDHIIGLPFFKPIYNPAASVNIWSGHLAGQMTTREMVSRFISPPWTPIDTNICKANLIFHDFHAGDVLTPIEGITIRTFLLDHPGGAIGYRIEWEGKSLALVYDIEHQPGILDPTALELMRQADIAVYDAAYTEDEMLKYKGFGHSTWEQGVKLAKQASTRKLVLFHHSPSRTDDELDRLEQMAQDRFAETVAARDGMVLEL